MKEVWFKKKKFLLLLSLMKAYQQTMTKHFWARQTQVKLIWFQRREGVSERCGLNIIFCFVC